MSSPPLLNHVVLDRFAQQQTLILIRIYSYLSILSGVIVIGAGFMRTVVHFIYKVCVDYCCLQGIYLLTISAESIDR